MKPSLKPILCGLAIILFISLSASAQTRPNRPAVEKPIALTVAQDSLQYTLGAYLGAWIVNNGFMVTNPDIFRKGMDDVLLNRPLLIDAASVATKLDGYQKRMISERSSQQERLLFENVKGKEGVGMLPSGVAYVVMKAGNGIRPQLNDSVLIHVKGFLPDANLFEDTYAKNAPIRMTPAGLIPGMAEALQIMPVGSTWRLFIPSALAYAERGIPGLIPAYSALIFEVELIDAVRR
ncbi:MAG: FKBP-type peptidyl-prolyl cis-trans isomerase [Daejeonella sp.]|uniref:FKBP-type peptidyl-prolyl cis-trans isomerase n=1 Tax=Daejeonella sp. TaxID=2805397 RepID=UPI0027369F11|nr:FKBP-type peptidyl-prolyl cis-trans isomerase [Daejeonella sp.]MDP3468575.1 FKBP-type peptidyl-prolyl cis-trans isomerase [Daejeonella sp.]